MHSGNISTFTQQGSDALAAVALKAPINNPTCIGNVTVHGTLSCPQLNPAPSQNNLDTIKTLSL